ncbi:serine/threonine-protein kinase [Aromatoleum evansii]|uniref:Serine/threonine-protein kinase n=1 Tax=Aromatoleum evansii TaxID=59406 RepID=A0ABZ1AU18_AROEV|nr:serine/threonine-protein kinase [Aromatoleum evansii]NMG27456.1 protein kinase [Aromatoleum evansii]WRL47608.1 serine/threonine-protein kinase [Aromatoleum evansii]
MSEMPLTIGKYRIVKEVGRGATAVVYMAESADWPVPIALKLIRFNDKSKDESKWNRRLLKLLKAEKAVSTRLDHPHIIHVHDVVIEAEQAYVVMEYFPGESLERYCSFERMLPVHRAIGIVFKCCMALDYAYRQGIVHRDIKPANILVDDQDNVKITDFGLALNISKKVESDSTFIMGVGSPAYMSPEQIKGYQLNQKTDLYSLGVVLFNLLTGRLPFRASNPAQLIYKIINADPPRVSQLNPELPEQMDAVIRKALEKDLYSRYKNGAEFAKELSAVRYQLVDDTYVPPDTSRFSLLRKLAFFTEFDDIELWEVLRLSAWRVVDCGTTLIREGDADQRFGVVVDGEIEVSVDGRRVSLLGAGEVFGEIAWLDSVRHRHMTTVTSVSQTTYLEVNPSALALATDELRELFRVMLATIAVRRLGEALHALSADGEPAVASKFTASGLDLQLVED